MADDRHGVKRDREDEGHHHHHHHSSQNNTKKWAGGDDKPYGERPPSGQPPSPPASSLLGNYDGGEQVEEIVAVPDDQVGRIIGKKGASLNTITALTKAQVDIPPQCPPGSNLRHLKVTGTRAQVSYCRTIIIQKVNSAGEEGGPSGMPLPREGDADPANPITTKTIRVPNNMVGKIIGRQGATIKTIQELSSVHTDIAKECAPGSSERSVSITGNPGQIAYCEQLIHSVLNGEALPQSRTGGAAPHALAAPNPNEAKILIPNDLVGKAIGKGGETIKSLQDQSGARMEVSKDCPPGMTQREITLTGDPTQIQTIISLLSQKLAPNAKGNNVVTVVSGVSAAPPPAYGAPYMPMYGMYPFPPYGYPAPGAPLVPPGAAAVPFAPPPPGGAPGYDPAYGYMYPPHPHDPAAPPAPAAAPAMVDPYAAQWAAYYAAQAAHAQGQYPPPHAPGYPPAPGAPAYPSPYGGAAPPAHGADYYAGQPGAQPTRGGAQAAQGQSNGSGDDAVTTNVITVPNDLVGRIIGKQGASIKEIQEQSGAKLDIPQDTHTPTREVSITGTPSQIALCTTLIHQKMAARF